MKGSHLPHQIHDDSDGRLIRPRGSSGGEVHRARAAHTILDRLLNQAGIPKVNHAGEKLDIHALRTTCASRMLRSRVPLTIVQSLMGHSSPTLTAQAYSDMHVEDIRSAVESMPGLGQAGEAKAKEAR